MKEGYSAAQEFDVETRKGKAETLAGDEPIAARRSAKCSKRSSARCSDRSHAKLCQAARAAGRAFCPRACGPARAPVIRFTLPLTQVR